VTISFVTIGQKITAYIANLIITQVNRQSLTTTIPTSVAGSGVSVSANGKVSFTTATTVSVNGCFTTDYDNYRIIIDISATSTSNGGGVRMRASGTDNSATEYRGRQSYGTVSTFATAAFATTSFPYAAVVATEHFIIIDINAPAIARPTRAQLTASAWVGTTATADTFVNMKHNVSTAYDGFTLTPSTGNITGTLTIHGYNTGA